MLLLINIEKIKNISSLGSPKKTNSDSDLEFIELDYSIISKSPTEIEKDKINKELNEKTKKNESIVYQMDSIKEEIIKIL